MPCVLEDARCQNAFAKDDQGVELPSLEAAWKAAHISARELLADNIKTNSKDICRNRLSEAALVARALSLPAGFLVEASVKNL